MTTIIDHITHTPGCDSASLQAATGTPSRALNGRLRRMVEAGALVAVPEGIDGGKLFYFMAGDPAIATFKPKTVAGLVLDLVEARPEGVTVAYLAEEHGVKPKAAHTALLRLVDLGHLAMRWVDKPTRHAVWVKGDGRPVEMLNLPPICDVARGMWPVVPVGQELERATVR